MAQNKKRSGGGFKGMLASGFILVIIAAGLFAVVRNNNIENPSDAYEYFKSWSDKAWECGAGKADWKCNGSSGRGGSDEGSEKNKNVSDKFKSSTSKDKALAQLDKVKVQDRVEVAYKRSEWKHWTGRSGSSCNTREDVLKAQGDKVKTDKDCRVLSGTWIDPYSKDKFTNSSKLDIDHVIPLSAAAQSGGQAWSKEKKEKFANDKSQLLAVSATENRKKSDDGPGDYMPPNKDFRCDYSKMWIDTSLKYGLSIEKSDKTALTSALRKCSS